VELIATVGFAGVTAIDFRVGALRVKVAMMVVATAGIVKVHVGLVVFGHGALQLVNAEFAPTVAVRVSCVAAVTFAVQPLAEPLVQLIPAPVTVPAPVPWIWTVRRGAATAVTLIAPDVPVMDVVSVSVAVMV
jgi:hypothetical protein